VGFIAAEDSALAFIFIDFFISSRAKYYYITAIF